MNIPNFENTQFVDRQGFLTPSWQLIMQSLLTQLRQNAGNEGLVAPTQTATNIGIIAANTAPAFKDGPSQYTCQYGTIMYDSTDNSIRISINNGSGAPVFKTVTLT